MAKCDFCGKGVTFGIKVSHSHRRSNFIDNLNESTDQSLYSGLFLLSKFYRLFTNKLVVYGSVWFVPLFKTSLYYIFKE